MYVYGGEYMHAHVAHFKLLDWAKRKGPGGWDAMESLLTGSASQIRKFVDSLDSSGGDRIQPTPHRRQ